MICSSQFIFLLLIARFLPNGIVWILLTSACGHMVLAADLAVVDVRKNIALADTDPVYKDYYINGGADAGLKKNQILTMVRKVAVRDSSGSQSIGDMKIPVGHLKIIAVYAKVAVARELRLFSRDEHPMLEQVGIMIGDLLDLENPITIKSVPVSGPTPTPVPPQAQAQAQDPGPALAPAGVAAAVSTKDSAVASPAETKEVIKMPAALVTPEGPF